MFCAKDTPTLEAIQDKPRTAAEKLRWLSWHDGEMNDICGILPLAYGLPAAMTDHEEMSCQAAAARQHRLTPLLDYPPRGQI